MQCLAVPPTVAKLVICLSLPAYYWPTHSPNLGDNLTNNDRDILTANSNPKYISLSASVPTGLNYTSLVAVFLSSNLCGAQFYLLIVNWLDIYTCFLRLESDFSDGR